jgi:hypothetical protein
MRELRIHDPLSLRVSEFDALLGYACSGEFTREAIEGGDARAYVESQMRAR